MCERLNRTHHFGFRALVVSGAGIGVLPIDVVVGVAAESVARADVVGAHARTAQDADAVVVDGVGGDGVVDAAARIVGLRAQCVEMNAALGRTGDGVLEILLLSLQASMLS